MTPPQGFMRRILKAWAVYMIIDFHTHAFPDALAPKAMKSLTDGIEGFCPPVYDGTVSGLLGNMDEWRVGVSVIQPIVTKRSQFEKTNEWAKSIESDRIIPFGSLYPHGGDYKRDIDFLAGMGFKGLKFHAEYQDFDLDDPHMMRIYDYVAGRGLILLHHAGFDPSFKPPFRSNPRMFAKVADALKGGVLIAAHLGGHAQWDDVERHLVGKDIYLDTSMGFGYYTEEQFLRIAGAHGTDRILFATDAPWSHAGDEISSVEGLPLPQAEKDAILGGNAARLLELEYMT